MNRPFSWFYFATLWYCCLCNNNSHKNKLKKEIILRFRWTWKVQKHIFPFGSRKQKKTQTNVNVYMNNNILKQTFSDLPEVIKERRKKISKSVIDIYCRINFTHSEYLCTTRKSFIWICLLLLEFVFLVQNVAEICCINFEMIFEKFQ